MEVAVVGLGAIGLPVAAAFATRGHVVIGCDVDERVVGMVQAGEDPHGREPGLDRSIERLRRTGRLDATTNTSEAVSSSEASIVLVPLLLGEDEAPDYGPLEAATEAIGQGLRPGHLVVYETTVPVGDTRGRFTPLLEKWSGLRAGSDFHVAFSPERVLVGRIQDDLAKYPKVVGGIDELSCDRAVRLYGDGLGARVLRLDSAEAAEFTKLAETTYRSVNIGLANEFAAFCEESGIDLPAVIAAANSQPFSHIHAPGVGVGGHCIPVYPYFYLRSAEVSGGAGAPAEGHLSERPGRSAVRITRAALAANEAAPARCIQRLEAVLGGLDGSVVAILGWGYRDGSGDASFSVARHLADLLRARGARVLGHDPKVSPETITGYGVDPVELTRPVEVDAVVVQASHPEYEDLHPRAFPGCRALLDGRNQLEAERWRRAGVAFLGVGRPERAAVVPVDKTLS